MTFLQPFILWGLPLALLPIIIHLLNRMRYRTTRWAAMSFLFSANRASTRWAKLRQCLILACRVLALLALVLAVARPLAGGWLGWALSPSPDVILILLDRSASMETHDATNTATRREQALRALAAAAGTYVERSRFVLIENALRKPQEIANPSLLPQLPMTGATDTAADIPAMLDVAADWLAHNKTGLSEIWIASDLQRTNWQPDSNRWPALAARLAALPQGIRVRLLALTQTPGQNNSISTADLRRRDRAGQAQLDLTLDVERAETAPASLPVTLTLDDTRSNFDLALQGQSTRSHRVLPLDPAHGETGWGKIELPADANAHDNTSYFIYAPKPALRAALVAADEQSRRYLRFAVAPAQTSQQTCDVIPDPGNTEWQKYALILWQAELPTGDTAQQLTQFAERGGVIIFFPPDKPSAAAFAGASWGKNEDAGQEQPFRVAHWDQQEGPLANSEEGLTLPVSELAVTRRAAIAGGGDPRASFGDAQPFLTERALKKGRVFFCATLPNSDWSNLNDGRVLVPMLQRLLEAGAKRFDESMSLLAGDAVFAENASAWESVDSAVKPKDPRFDAGIYRNGARLVAVNRPPDEDTLEVAEKTAVKQLFGTVPLQFFEERGAEAAQLQGEIWRALLITMLALMLAEALLSLPLQSAQTPSQKPAAPSPRSAQTARAGVAEPVSS